MSAQDTISPVYLNVFPNTGHQFFHVNLRELVGDDRWRKQISRFFEICKNKPWCVWDATYFRWLRFQYDIEENEPILRIAVETNLGFSNRGLLFDEDPELLDEQPDEDNDIPAYAATEEAEIEEEYENRLLPLDFLPVPDKKHLGDRERAELQKFDRSSRKLEDSNGNNLIYIFWVKPDGHHEIDVDLIVDLGNTRTVALLLESPGQDDPNLPFGRRIRVLQFPPRGMPFSMTKGVETDLTKRNSYAIIDSWFLLHRPVFAENDPPMSEDKLIFHYQPVHDPATGQIRYKKRTYLPHQFVEISPALIGGGQDPGGAAHTFSGTPLDFDARFFMSSPKRYVWDDEQLGYRGGTIWKQIPNKTEKPRPDFYHDLGGLIRFFMDTGGHDWDIENPPSEDDFRGVPFPSERPSYPRRDAVCWFALSIIENAYRQINSFEYLNLGRRGLPRRLRNIRVTYPAGWTQEEIDRYLEQWQRAINLFTLTRFEQHQWELTSDSPQGRRPTLAHDHLDEAVASQLPVLYSEFKSLPDVGRQWFSLYGNGEKVKVMNLDIGGGTTDISVIEYRDLSRDEDMNQQDLRGANAELRIAPKLMFRDGFTVAGDNLVKRIIERVILPAWVNCRGPERFMGFDNAKEWIIRFFKNPSDTVFAAVDPRSEIKLARSIRLVLIPLANELLKRIARGEKAWQPLTVEGTVHADSLRNDLNYLANKLIRKSTTRGSSWSGDVFPLDANLQCDRKVVEDCIDEVFEPLMKSLGDIAGRIDCDLIVLSGKPSELPQIRTLIERYFPVLPQRLIQVKDYPAGSWYPFANIDTGRIVDAKTCTVVGAALHQDSMNGISGGFCIHPEQIGEPEFEFDWGVIPGDQSARGFKEEELIFESDESSDEKECTLPLNGFIGRLRRIIRDMRPEPIYQLRYRGGNVGPITVPVRVSIRRVVHPSKGEWLELISAEPPADRPDIDPDDIVLKLNPMAVDRFWLDQPTFDASAILSEG